MKKQPFLDAYARTGTLTAAARALGINRSAHYEWLKNDPDYARQFAAAEDAVADMLHSEAIRRAFAGSDTLLIFLLKGHRPEMFKERYQVERTTPVDEELKRLAAEVRRRG